MKTLKNLFISLILCAVLPGIVSGFGPRLSSRMAISGSAEYYHLEEDFAGTNGDSLNTREVPNSFYRWVSSTGTISGNALRHTEVPGSEVLDDTGFDAACGTSWTCGASWSIAGSLASFDDLSTTALTQTQSLSANTFYTWTFTVANSVGSSIFGLYSAGGGTSLVSNETYADGSHARYFKAPAGIVNLGVWGSDTGAAFDLSTTSLKPLTLADNLTLAQLGFQSGRYWYTPAAAVGELSGIVLFANDSVASTDGLWCYVDRTAGKLQVFKRVASVDTPLLSTAITYSATAAGLIVYDPTQGKVSAYYNELAVGTPQAYTPGTGHTWGGAFSTGAATLDNFNFKPITYLQPVTVTGITKANPGVVTATGHGYLDGDLVYFSGLTEMTELNGTYHTITNKAANTFEILDTSGYGAAETTGGAVCRKVN